MEIIRHKIYDLSRSDVIRVIPIGDIHLGAKACDEKLLRHVVKSVQNDPLTYWIGMGDYCLSHDTEILTDDGWKTFDTLNINHRAAVFNPETKITQFEVVDKKWFNQTNEPMIHIEGPLIDSLVTNSHRILINKRSRSGWSDYKTIKARELIPGKTKSIYRIPVAAERWVGQRSTLDLSWFSLKGFIDTEGSVETRGNSVRIEISQSEMVNPDVVLRIRAAIDDLGLNPNEYRRDNGVILWRFNADDTRYIQEHIGQKGEYVPEIMNAIRNQLLLYFDALMDGDGTWSRQCFMQKEKPLVDIFQELCFKLGYRSRVVQYSDGWCCYYGHERGIHSLIKSVGQKSYSGTAWCITTKTGYIVTRRNHKIVVLGNCDFINRSDRRFDPTTVASWVDLTRVDIAQQQLDALLDIFTPIAPKCLGLLRGNHERDITLKYENDVYSRFITDMRQAGQIPLDYKLKLDYEGWLVLSLYRGSAKGKKAGSRAFKFLCHHGFGGGRLAGGKALNMERWLWLHNCDIALMGHTHEVAMPIVRSLMDISGNDLVERKKIGAWTGTFLRTNVMGAATYSEVHGYFPRPIGGIEILLNHGAEKLENIISVVSGI